MLETAFTLLGTAVTWLEVIAFVLALANIAFNVFEIHWGWPLAIVASALYVWLFYASKLYGEASVNIFFALTALWGWWQWLRGSRSNTEFISNKNSPKNQSENSANDPWKAAPVLGLEVIRLNQKGFLLALISWL